MLHFMKTPVIFYIIQIDTTKQKDLDLKLL
jgi:hypothetical protein